MSRAPTLYGKEALPRSRSHDRFGPLVGGDLILDLANTTDRHGEQGAADDLAPGYANVVDWFEYADVLDAQQSRRLLLVAGKNPRDAAAIRRRLMALRDATYAIILAIIDQGAPETPDLDVLNEELARARAARDLVASHGGLDWDWVAPIGLDRVLWEASLAAERLLTSDRLARLRQCDAPDCQRVFLDTSRNGSRRYCTSTGCGAVERIRRFRDRQRPAT
jgi:predicted RNA-binding Zn ribbon-like protein